MSAEADRALGKAQGGNNSQGPIYKVPVSNLNMTVCRFAWATGYEIHTVWCLKPCGCLIPLEHLYTTLHTLTYLPASCVVPLQASIKLRCLCCLQDALGKQLLSTMASAPNPGFGTSSRPSMAQRAAAPGPGAYRIKAALGEIPTPAIVTTEA